MKQATYRVLLRREPEGVYMAMIPSIPGCVTWGETVEEAIAMVREAAEGCLEVYAEKGINIQDDSETNEELNRTIPVPMHGNRDMAKGTFYTILKQAGIDRDDV